MSEQTENLDRVANAIAPIVLDFCAMKLASSGGLFHMTELVAYVTRKALFLVAPDSPSRILRDLAHRGQIKYRVLSRRQSLYQLEPVNGDQT